MRAYVTKWATSKGILEADVFASDGSDVALLSDGTPLFRGEWYWSLEDAGKDFDRRKFVQVAYMNGSIERLKARIARMQAKEMKVSVMVSKKGKKND